MTRTAKAADRPCDGRPDHGGLLERTCTDRRRQQRTNSTTANHVKAVKFSECMRANGVSGLPDPNASGQLTIDGVANGSSVNPNTPAFTRALGACKKLEPSGFTGSKRSSQQQQAALRFAECIRKDGVSDFRTRSRMGPSWTRTESRPRMCLGG